MIVLDGVWKDVEVKRMRIPVFQNLSTVIPTDRRLAILGLPGSGKSTLMDLISGLQKPDHGSIRSDVTISVPVGRPVGLIPAHSLRRNCVFVARIHGLAAVELIRFVSSVAGIAGFMDMPLGDVSPDVASSFRYAIAYAVPADTYVVDGSPLPRGIELRDRFTRLVEHRTKTNGLILCTQSPNTAKAFCDCGAVLHDGQLTLYPDLDRALSAFGILKIRYAAGSETEASETNLLNARRALRRGDIDLVAQIAEAEAEQSEENGAALWLRGEVALARGDRAKGVALIMQACDLGPEIGEAWVTLARLAATETDHGTRLAMAIVLLEHESSRFRRAGAKLVEASGDMLAALNAWRAVLNSDPQDPTILLEIAEAENRQGNYVEALNIADRALALDPGSWRALIVKIRMEQSLERYDNMSATVIDLARVRPNVARRYIRVIDDAGFTAAARAVQEFIDVELSGTKV